MRIHWNRVCAASEHAPDEPMSLVAAQQPNMAANCGPHILVFTSGCGLVKIETSMEEKKTCFYEAEP